MDYPTEAEGNAAIEAAQKAIERILLDLEERLGLDVVYVGLDRATGLTVDIDVE